MKIKIPDKVNYIINNLENNGYEAYAVGGCVRDTVLNRIPHDWDVTTSALPVAVKKIFKKTVDTGIIHGTVTVIIDKEGYEVTTYRIDGEYEDGRHPKLVEFTRNIIEDLKRRDFTINAMAYNDRGGFVDEFGGLSDIEKKMVRCVGNPYERFNEDALRILRAIRFAAVLSFEIEKNTKEAVVKLACNLSKISKERIQTELDKLLVSDNPQMIHEAYNCGITKVVLKEYDRLVKDEKNNKILNILKRTRKNHYLRWSALMCESGRETSSKVLRELKFDNKTIDIVSRISQACKRDLPENKAQTRISIYEIGEDIYPIYLEFMGCYLEGDNEKIDRIMRITRDYEDIIENKECISLRSLAVNGKDLIDIGVERGEEVGIALKKLLYEVLNSQELNNKETLLNIFMDTQS